MIRFEILLPLFYNDGRPVEREKFLETDDEVVRLFGATSTDTVVVRGRWVNQSTVYHDQLLRVRIDSEETAENWQAVRNLKETLKSRFDQLDILDYRPPDRHRLSVCGRVATPTGKPRASCAELPITPAGHRIPPRPELVSVGR